LISLSLLSFSLSPSPPPLSIQHHKEYLGKFCLKLLLARNGFHLPPPQRKEFRTQLGFLVRYVGCTRVPEVSRKAYVAFAQQLHAQCTQGELHSH
jgi:hypothetical protein